MVMFISLTTPENNVWHLPLQFTIMSVSVYISHREVTDIWYAEATLTWRLQCISTNWGGLEIHLRGDSSLCSISPKGKNEKSGNALLHGARDIFPKTMLFPHLGKGIKQFSNYVDWYAYQSDNNSCRVSPTTLVIVCAINDITYRLDAESFDWYTKESRPSVPDTCNLGFLAMVSNKDRSVPHVLNPSMFAKPARRIGRARHR